LRRFLSLLRACALFLSLSLCYSPFLSLSLCLSLSLFLYFSLFLPLSRSFSLFRTFSHGIIVVVSWRIYTCAMTHSFGWHDWFMCVTCRIHACAACVHVSWHTYEWVMSHIWMSVAAHVNASHYDSFIDMSWRIHAGSLTHSYVWHDDSLICVLWLIEMCIGLLCRI